MKCEEKRKFKTEKEANKIINVSIKKFNINQYSYKCPKCKFYHLTRNSPEKELKNAKFRQAQRIEKEARFWEKKFKIKE